MSQLNLWKLVSLHNVRAWQLIRHRHTGIWLCDIFCSFFSLWPLICYSLSSLICLIYWIPLLCNYIHEEAPPIRIHSPIFFGKWLSMSYWTHKFVESASSTPEKEKLHIITFCSSNPRHNFPTISYYNLCPNWIFENLCHYIMFGRDN